MGCVSVGAAFIANSWTQKEKFSDAVVLFGEIYDAKGMINGLHL